MTNLKFTPKRAVTLPIMKLPVDKAVYIRLDDVIHKGKQLEGEKEPVNLVNVTDLETGEQAQIVVPKVLYGVLTESFENDAYIGLSFQVIKHKMASGKKYHNFTVVEIEVEEPAAEQPAEQKKGK